MKKVLSKKALRYARHFIFENARPLEIARFTYAFENGSSLSVTKELEAFKNADGGFGNALEPDLRLPASSALCTSVALQIARGVDAAAGLPLIRDAVKYLSDTFDSKGNHWRIIPPEAEATPHAPWWTQDGREESFEKFSLNPTAEILGYHYDYSIFFDVSVVQKLESAILDHLHHLTTIEMHDLLCCVRLLQSNELPETYGIDIFQALQRLLGSCLATDPEQWGGYFLRPLQVVTHPASTFYSMYKDVVEKNLDYEINTQNEDGSWPVTWSWGDAYPKEWQQAKREWSGILTLEKLLILKDFGRIEGQ